MLISEFLFCFEDDDEKKVLRMVNYSTNINERNNHISPQNIGKKREKKPTTYYVRNHGPSLREWG
jgi:hypothetical protein